MGWRRRKGSLCWRLRGGLAHREWSRHIRGQRTRWFRSRRANRGSAARADAAAVSILVSAFWISGGAASSSTGGTISGVEAGGPGATETCRAACVGGLLDLSNQNFAVNTRTDVSTTTGITYHFTIRFHLPASERCANPKLLSAAGPRIGGARRSLNSFALFRAWSIKLMSVNG